jgi:hypothetical protein
MSSESKKTVNSPLKSYSTPFIGYTRLLIILKILILITPFFFFADDNFQYLFRDSLSELGVNTSRFPESTLIDIFIVVFGGLGLLEFINFRRSIISTGLLVIIAIFGTYSIHNIILPFEAIGILDLLILFSLLGMLYLFISNLGWFLILFAYFYYGLQNDPQVLDFFNNTIYVSYDENTNDTIVTDFAANSRDLNWAILDGPDSSLFAINANTGHINFISMPDFENPKDNDSNNRYELMVATNDNSETVSTQTIIITVNDMDEIRPVISYAKDISFAENSTSAVLTFAADEPVTWSILSGLDSNHFTIDSNSGLLRFSSSPDYESPSDANQDNTYQLQISASDLMNNVTEEQVGIRVIDIDDTSPLLNSDSENLDLIEFRENSNRMIAVITANEFVTWALSGVDSAYFEINEKGVITFSNTPDFENPLDNNADNLYEISVIATDGNNNSSEIDINVAVTNARGLLGLFD